MARAGRTDEELEDLLARHVAITEACSILALRIGQTLRRIRGNELATQVLTPTMEEVTIIVDENAQCHETICRILERRRTEREKKRRDKWLLNG